jgi:pyruvate/2-oxoglutarate dehydrogenase complex dihydrolipoamide acyltransferase (E2) component
MPESSPFWAWNAAGHDFLLNSSMSDFDDWMKQNTASRPQEIHAQGISPLAKRMAEESHLDWRSIKGSGKDGLILERDVLQAIAKKT